MSSIEKAIERYKKTTKFGTDSLDIDFALADSYGNSSPAVTQQEQEQENSTGKEIQPVSPKVGGPHYSFNYSALSKQGFLTPNNERNVTAEEYRALKRPILMNAFGKGAVPIERGNLLMVVSSVPGEGKTFTSFNLAMSMAMERDKTVLLVDSDVIKQSLTRLLGLESRLGLLDVLKNPSLNIGDVIIRTNLPNFSIIPAGQAQINSTELLASEEMEKVSADLSARYPDRIVLFDSPPILSTTEATVLAHLVGQILTVVEAGKTPQSVLQEALSRLDQDKVVGLLLNKSRRQLRSDYYGGYGSYGK